jgi:hypothetical protein
MCLTPIGAQAGESALKADAQDISLSYISTSTPTLIIKVLLTSYPVGYLNHLATQPFAIRASALPTPLLL